MEAKGFSQLMLRGRGGLRRCCSSSGLSLDAVVTFQGPEFCTGSRNLKFFDLFFSHYIRPRLPVLELLPSSPLPHWSPAVLSDPAFLVQLLPLFQLGEQLCTFLLSALFQAVPDTTSGNVSKFMAKLNSIRHCIVFTVKLRLFFYMS